MSPNLAKVTYVWTQTDTDNGFAVVPILWRSQMNSNYVCTWSLNDLGAEVDLDYYQGDMHNITSSGFNAVVYAYSPGYGNPGDKIIINAIGFDWNQGA